MDNPTPQAAVPWYLTKRTVILAIVVVGPLAIPLLWLSPKFSFVWKAVLTILLVASSVLLYHYLMVMMDSLNQRLKELKEMGAY